MPATPLQIDFVSDVSCPWCAIGLSSLEKAIANLQGQVTVDLRFQPFELNPHMVDEGQDITEHLTQKYGSSAEQQAQVREHIRQRGAEVGFVFRAEGRGRIYNTFDAHRLLHWAGEEGVPGQQHALKKALLGAYFTEGQNPHDPAVLVQTAASVGLDPQRAQAILDSDEFAQEVREHETLYTNAGIHSVPAIVINNRHLISGGQPVEVFEDALRKIATQG